MLLPCAGELDEADARLAPRLDAATSSSAIARAACPTRGSRRASAPQYAEYLCRRLAAPRGFAAEAEEARRAAPSPFQYAIVRVVPRVERGECVNAGVVLFCRPRGFLAARIALDAARVLALEPDADLDGRPRPPRRVRALRRGRRRRPGPMAALPASERFHWLVAPSSTVIQCSPVHTGLTDDPAGELERLFERLVR